METPIHSEFSSLPSLEIPNPPVTSGRRELRWALRAGLPSQAAPGVACGLHLGLGIQSPATGTPWTVRNRSRF